MFGIEDFSGKLNGNRTLQELLHVEHRARQPRSFGAIYRVKSAAAGATIRAMRPVLAAIAAAFLAGATSSPAAADCTCRARGVVAAHGQTLCIQTPQGPRLARCGKLSNVASWTFLDGTCPMAALNVPEGNPRTRQSARTIR
jgi:hypothetical protein